MEPSLLRAFAEVVREFGLSGLLLVFISAWLWFFLKKQQSFKCTEDIAEVIGQHRKDIDQVLAQYRENISDIKRMYEHNVALVEDYARTYDRLEKLHNQTMDAILINNQSLTRLSERIMANMYCPLIREKGPQHI
jgi:hypothetical protein